MKDTEFEDKIKIENRENVKDFFVLECRNRADILNTSYKILLTYLTHRRILLLSNEIR